ncbi:TPA: hypothetical protein HA253_02845 [Candidatus Woesearchaeota archaeon]|nr:hypothetical protein [Candidatus Woesearchaeota archaeon]
MTSQKPSHDQQLSHRSKSEAEETEDLLFSDIDVHKLRPKAEHQAPGAQEKDEDIIRRVKEKMQAQKSGLGSKASATAQLSSKFASASKADAEGEGSAKEIKISVNPSKLGKVLFAALFLFLAVSFFYNPFYNIFPWNQVSGSAVKDSSALEPDTLAPAEETDQEAPGSTEEKETAEQPVITDGLQDVEARPLDPADSAVTKKATTEGILSLEITDFKTEIKDWGGKVTEVSFEVENTKKAFVPKILVNVYDRKTMAAYRVRRVAVAEVFQQLETGQRLKGKVDVSKFSFTKEDFDKEKTIQLQLWDEGLTDSYTDDMQLAEALKTFTFGSN